MNLKRGFRRLTIVISLLVFVFAFFAVLAEESRGLHPITEDIPAALFQSLFWSSLIWLIYWIISFVISGFSSDDDKNDSDVPDDKSEDD